MTLSVENQLTSTHTTQTTKVNKHNALLKILTSIFLALDFILPSHNAVSKQFVLREKTDLSRFSVQCFSDLPGEMLALMLIDQYFY